MSKPADVALRKGPYKNQTYGQALATMNALKADIFDRKVELEKKLQAAVVEHASKHISRAESGRQNIRRALLSALDDVDKQGEDLVAVTDAVSSLAISTAGSNEPTSAVCTSAGSADAVSKTSEVLGLLSSKLQKVVSFPRQRSGSETNLEAPQLIAQPIASLAFACGKLTIFRRLL